MDLPPTSFHLRPGPAVLCGQVRPTLPQSAGPEALTCAQATGPLLSSLAKLHRPPAPPPHVLGAFGGAAGRLPSPLLLLGTDFPLRPAQGSRIDLLLAERPAGESSFRSKSLSAGAATRSSCPLRRWIPRRWTPPPALSSKAHVFNASPDSAWPPHRPPGPWGQALEGSATGCFLSAFPGPGSLGGRARRGPGRRHSGPGRSIRRGVQPPLPG